MKIIPVINCDSIVCVRERFEMLRTFHPRVREVHVDIGVPPVSSVKRVLYTKLLAAYAKQFSIGIHGMVPERYFFSHTHYASDARLLYYHMREIHHMTRFEARVRELRKKGIRVGVVLEGDDRESVQVPRGVRQVLILAVHPGRAGQKFNPRAMTLISSLRKQYPRVILTVDGGITPTIVRKLYRVGVDAVTSAAYIWESKKPQEAYQKLIKNMHA